MPKKETFLFICQEDDDDILILTKEDVDIKTLNVNEDIDFTVIGKISSNTSVDFGPSAIQWYEEKKRPKEFLDKVILKIVQALMYGTN